MPILSITCKMLLPDVEQKFPRERKQFKIISEFVDISFV